MLHSELLGGASLEALAMLLASSYALAENWLPEKTWLSENWLPGAAEPARASTLEEEQAFAGAAARRRAEALRPRGRSHCLSRLETPRIVRIRGQ